WLDSERFDVVAKIPENTPKDQIPLMMQALLAERFKLQVHHEKKDLPAYALLVGKNGPKMKESVIEENAGPDSGARLKPMLDAMPLPPPPPPGGSGGGMAGFSISGGKGGAPVLQGKGPMLMMMGRGHVQANQMTISGLADLLSRQTDRPVLDETGLTA